MASRGIAILRSSQTTAGQADWSAVVFPYQGAQTLGALLYNGLRRFNSPICAVLSAPQGRIIVSTNATLKTAMRALVPAYAAEVTPVPVFGQTATQWTLVSDGWNFAGAMLGSICLPQLSRRTVGAFVDRCLAAAPSDGFVLVDQDNGVLRIWQDFGSDTADGIDDLEADGDTVAAEFGSFSPLIFEGGTT